MQTVIGLRWVKWELYGHEEGDSSLDTTLKTVYNVPATTGTQLEVYYDAKDLVDGAVTSVTDLSPNTNGGLPSDSPQVSNGGFVFDGVNDYIYNSQSGYTASQMHTFQRPFGLNFYQMLEVLQIRVYFQFG